MLNARSKHFYLHVLNISIGIKVKIFDDAVIKIALSKALIGHLLLLSNHDLLALKELEESCPLLWEFQVAKISPDTDVCLFFID